MNRLITEFASLIGKTVGDLTKGWNAFFFKPADPTPLGLIRIATGALAFWSMLTLGFDLQGTLGSTGWVDPTLVSQQMTKGAWSFWLWVPDSLLWPVWIACLVVLACFTLGLWSRITAVLAWAIVASTARRLPVMVHGFESVLSAWLFYLAVTGASGQAASLDRFFGRWKKARRELVRRPAGRMDSGTRRS